MLKSTVFIAIFDYLKLFFRVKRKAVFCIKVSLFFIDVAIFSKKKFNTDAVSNFGV